jgi:hypothetical protein
MSRLDVDVNQPEFLPTETEVLRKLVDKHEQYQAQGRDLEARAMERAARIVWDTLKGDFDATQPPILVGLYEMTP